jgi:hypothetical protein
MNSIDAAPIYSWTNRLFLDETACFLNAPLVPAFTFGYLIYGPPQRDGSHRIDNFTQCFGFYIGSKLWSPFLVCIFLPFRREVF